MRKLKYLFACALMSSLVLACNDDDEPKEKEEESYCGDGVCDDDETYESCPEDCEEVVEPYCGDGVCDTDETDETCPEDCRDTGGIGAEAKTCVVTYDLTAKMAIEGTPGGMGDSVEDVTGQLALRYVQDKDGGGVTTPVGGEGVEILHFFIRNEMLVEDNILGTTLKIDTKVYGFTPDCNGETDLPDKKNLPEGCDFDVESHKLAKAVGVYSSDTNEITWDRCVKPDEFSGDPRNGGYTPEHSASGPGCLKDYHSQGNVNCEGGELCAAGKLDEGDNIQDSKWVQPLETFTLSADGDEVSAKRIRLPNAQPSSTYLSFEGTRVDIACDMEK